MSVEMLVIGVCAWASVMTTTRVDVVVINAVDAEVIDWDFAVSVSCFEVAVDMFVDVLLISVIIGVLTGVSVDALAEVNTNVLAGVATALEFVISEPFKEYSC